MYNKSIYLCQYRSAPSRLIELLEILDDLRVGDDCEDPPYARKEWRHWIDKDGDGQDTRQEVLISESLVWPIFREDGRKVIGGRWYDPYMDSLVSKPRDLDIDHVVPLGEAHKSGGCRWSLAKKKRYANDLLHEETLIAVSKGANRAKGQKDPAKWLPDNEAYHFEYVSSWIMIKDKWGLWVDEEEKMAIESVLETKCLGDVVSIWEAQLPK